MFYFYLIGAIWSFIGAIALGFRLEEKGKKCPNHKQAIFLILISGPLAWIVVIITFLYVAAENYYDKLGK